MSSLVYSKISSQDDEDGHDTTNNYSVDHDDNDAIELTDIGAKAPLGGRIKVGGKMNFDDGDEDEDYCYDGDYNDEDDDNSDDPVDSRRTRHKRYPGGGGGGGQYSQVDDNVGDDDGDHAIPAATTTTTTHTRLPLEYLEEQLLWNVWNRWEEPCILSIVVTVCAVLPVLVLWMYGAFAFINRFWILWPFAFHAQLRVGVSMWYIKCSSTVRFQRRRILRVVCSVMTIVEIVLCGLVYPMIGSILEQAFFRDVDGRVVDDWTTETRFLSQVILLGWVVVTLRCCVGGICLAIRIMKLVSPNSNREWRPTFWIPCGGGGGGDGGGNYISFDDTTRTRLYQTFRVITIVLLGVNGVCVLSAASHFGPWPMYSLPMDCDDMDETECALPFPSFHHMKVDLDTLTGWRVDLKGLPPLRGGLPFHPRFLNELDGFSTSE
jgi:hypothetical protein